jgi:hypothetical protein
LNLSEFNNIDKIVIKSYSNKEDHEIHFNIKEKRFNHLFFVKKQKYFKEKIYQNSKIQDVFKELINNNVGSITRIIPYDNLVFIQYEVRR